MKETTLTDQLVIKKTVSPALSVLLKIDHSKEVRNAVQKGRNSEKHKDPSPTLNKPCDGNTVFGITFENIIETKESSCF